jgi:hypothetical protein
VPPEYQNPDDDYTGKLYRGLARNTTEPFDFEIRTENVHKGFWNKINLFPPKERIVFLDLDTVIIDNIDFLFEYDGDFAILRDFYFPLAYGSAIMSIAPGFGAHILEDFRPGVTQKHFTGDQDWIRACVKSGDVDLWQDLYPGKLVSYKKHCMDKVPKDASIICFHGHPRPAEVQDLPIMRKHWI